MSEDLKPCPFCGQLPSTESLGEDGYYIICPNSECESVDGLSPEAWNKRPIEDALIEARQADIVRLAVVMTDVERLRDACQHAIKFIHNGVEYGYIRLPDPELNDPASNTETVLRAALEPKS